MSAQWTACRLPCQANRPGSSTGSRSGRRAPPQRSRVGACHYLPRNTSRSRRPPHLVRAERGPARDGPKACLRGEADEGRVDSHADLVAPGPNRPPEGEEREEIPQGSDGADDDLRHGNRAPRVQAFRSFRHRPRTASIKSQARPTPSSARTRADTSSARCRTSAVSTLLSRARATPAAVSL